MSRKYEMSLFIFRKQMVTYLEFLDLFDKNNQDELKIYSKLGTLISLVLTGLSFLLFVANIAVYVYPEIYRDLSVSPTLISTTEVVNLSLTIRLSMPCYFLHIDQMDTLGFQESYIKSTVTFRRVNELGKIIGLANESMVDECHSCYNYSDPSDCCNTCEKLNFLAAIRGMPFNPNDFQVCKEKPKQPEITVNEKCLVKGKLTINRVAGTFHIAPGRNMKGQQYPHELVQSSFHDLSHNIERLRFGPHIPRTSNPLDNFRGIQKVPQRDRTYQYNLLVTPVVFMRDGKEVTRGYEYTAFQNELDSNPFFGVFPGLYFFYQFTPYTIVVVSNRQPFLSFISNTFGVISGIYALLSLFDALIDNQEDSGMTL